MKVNLPECGTCHGSGKRKMLGHQPKGLGGAVVTEFDDACPNCGGRGWLIPDHAKEAAGRLIATDDGYDFDDLSGAARESVLMRAKEYIVAAVLSVIEGNEE